VKEAEIINSLLVVSLHFSYFPFLFVIIERIYRHSL
jgi:hypothetical protein